MAERHEFGEPLPDDVHPDPEPTDKDPDQHVGGRFVGDRLLTHTVIDSGSTVRYRVGIDEDGRGVVDRLYVDPFAPTAEPNRINLVDAPDFVRDDLDELRTKTVSGHGGKRKRRP